MSSPNATLDYRVTRLEEDIRSLAKKVDRLTWALVMLALSITTSAIAIVITFSTARPR